MNVTGLRSRVESLGGEITDVGYVAHGRGNETAHVEAYFESHEELPELRAMEFCDRVTVDRKWDPEHNGVMFTVDY